MTIFTTLRNLHSQLISPKVFYKHLKIYNGKSFIQKTFNKAHLFSKISTYVCTKALGKTIHDSERNRKRKAKKKNNKIMELNVLFKNIKNIAYHLRKPIEINKVFAVFKADKNVKYILLFSAKKEIFNIFTKSTSSRK